MNDFTKSIAKFTIIVSILLAVLLLLLAGILIFAPEILQTILRYGVLAFCIIVSCIILIFLIKCVFLKEK